MSTFRKRIADILRIAEDRYGFGAGRDLGQITKWDPKKGHVRSANSPDDWESLAETLFDLEWLKAKIWDSKTKSFRIIEDHSPFYAALRKDPPKLPEWSGVFKKEGESRKVFQAFNSVEKQEQPKPVNQIKKKYNYYESDLMEICFAVSWHESKAGTNAKLASIMTSRGNIKYPGRLHSTPAVWCKNNPDGFRQYLYRLRVKAKKHRLYKAVPPDYWKIYA